jgi:hypothetical protein
MSIASIWHKYLGGQNTPWASVKYSDGKMSIDAYNTAFVDNLRQKFGYLSDGKSDDEVVEIFINRENIESEAPRLDVKHSGIDSQGRIKMELDWNTSFIYHLAEHGIVGETEEEAVQKYLTMITKAVVDEDLSDSDEIRSQLETEVSAEFDLAASKLAEIVDQLPKSRLIR